ncbi:alpha-glucuronidase family glycosyl hydrolase [Streptomyces hygroscopicus]|uniref:alpha-glucuronidase family glycosyl hydrolase n=1 Tax=Streptomyces hygroscopicus TaxID=1912 RepID=UPI00340FF6BD
MARSAYEFSRGRVLQASALALVAVPSPWGTAAGFAESAGVPDEDGYDLWLRYRPTADVRRLAEYREALAGLARQGEGPVMDSAELELRRAARGLTGGAPVRVPADRASGVIGAVDESPVVRSQVSPDRLARIGAQGFVIEMTGPPGRRRLVIGARGARGVLAGVFRLIRLLQLERPPHKLSGLEKPRTALRMMSHWDNFDRSIERGYAGTPLFAWDKLPDISDRLVDYARSMASIGINASVLNNVNPGTDFITGETLTRLRPLAALLQSWGISTWLAVNYAIPMLLTAHDADPITTADPADRRVQQWCHRPHHGHHVHGGGRPLAAVRVRRPGPRRPGAVPDRHEGRGGSGVVDGPGQPGHGAGAQHRHQGPRCNRPPGHPRRLVRHRADRDAGAEQERTVTAPPVSTPGFATAEIRLTSGDEEIERGRSVSVVTTPHPGHAATAFDAGPPSSPLLTGYARLSPEDVCTDDRGFGWVGDRPDTRDRGNADDLRRDIVTQRGKPIVRRVPVPAGKHTVWVLTGDSLTDSGITTISEDGTLLGRSGDDSPPSRAFVWFSFDLDGGAGGRTADLEITGSKLNGLWRIASLVVV